MLVLGLGKTGLSLINFLIKSGANNIYAWDDDRNRRGLISNNIVRIVEPRDLDWKVIKKVFVSPGIPVGYPEPHNVIKLANENNCVITSDINLFCELCRSGTTIGITGTNGKSTVTKMISDILTNEGYRAACIGNIGEPVFNLDSFDNDFFCIELSSFQLELCNNIAFNVAVLLDITPDHMDRYQSFEDYAKAKANIFNNPETTAIISVNKEINRKILATLKNRIIVPISTEKILQHGFSMIGNKMYENGIEIDYIVTKNRNHNENILASYVCAKLLTKNIHKIKQSIENYTPIPHRLEFLAKYRNFAIINDSKATNAESANRALSLYEKVYWIAGGKIKKDNQLNMINVKNVKKAFFFGESKDLLFEVFRIRVPCEICQSLKDALAKSVTIATNDEDDVTILFSPAHSSFDEFKSFEHRGDYFRSLVQTDVE